MKMQTMKPVFILSIACLLSVSGGCGNTKPYVEKPEDQVVTLKTIEESPTSPERDYKIGETVAIIRNNGAFELEGEIIEIGKNLVLAEDAWSRKMSWEPSSYSRSQADDEKFASKGYRVSTQKGRSYVYEWLPARQVFPVPWANNVNLKVGDQVLVTGYGEPYKGSIAALPNGNSEKFYVKYEGYSDTRNVESKYIYSSIEPAQPENLSPGTIVNYDRWGWAIVVGKRDDKIIIRRESFSAEDIMVHISKLQIFK